jgi:hypothetical protein
MSNARSNGGAIQADGDIYDWHLHREPHLSDDEGWLEMAAALRQQDAKRGALLDFPPPKPLLNGLARGRPSSMMRRSLGACAPQCRLVGAMSRGTLSLLGRRRKQLRQAQRMQIKPTVGIAARKWKDDCRPTERTGLNPDRPSMAQGDTCQALTRSGRQMRIIPPPHDHILARQ